MSLSNRFKAAYHSAGKALFYIEGPNQCDHASNIADAFNGHHEQLHKSHETNFAVPESRQAALNNFFYQKKSRKIPAITLSRIPSGRAYARGVVISPDGCTVARDLSVDFGEPFEKHFLCGKRIQRPLQLRGSALCVASQGTNSYYHWLLDELPRHLIVPDESFDRIICSRDTVTNQQALRLLGKDADSVVYVDIPSRLLGSHYQAEMLVVPSYVAPTGDPTRLLVDLLAEFVQPLISKSKNYPPKIFITRAKASGRRLMQENKIFASFEAAGYVRIKLEDLSWEEQINLFYHAREICAPHGAGLANLAFCFNSPLVIEVFNSHYVHWCFWKLAHLVNAEYIPLALPSEGTIEHDAAFRQANIQTTQSDISLILRSAGIYLPK